MSVEDLTENVWTRLIARGAMIVTPIIVILIGWLSIHYLDGRFVVEDDSIAIVKNRVDHIEAAANTAADKAEAVSIQTAVLENNQRTGREVQDQINSKLDIITGSIADLREKVGALSARSGMNR